MTRWDHARAALIALHMVAVFLLAFPAPVGGMSRATWKDPTVQAELSTWRERLSVVGVVMTQREFEDALFARAVEFMSLRTAVLRPFGPYYKYCGTWQSWRMFVAPHMFPARLEIAVDDGEGYRVVYRERDPEAEWMRPVFDQDRMRSVTFRMSWKNYATDYEFFVDWIAREAARDFPDATKVRVRFMRRPSPSPEAVLAGEIEPEKPSLARERDLEALR